MNEAVTLAMRPAPAGQATDRPAPAIDGVRFIMPGESKVALGLNGAIHQAFGKLTLAADR
jgi:hypothetical protein